jgi:DNA-directed RNA polymerase subunit RPC12/RpoP
MLVHKCDNCKKEIKKGEGEVVAGLGWPNYSFCIRCGKPIIAFLKKSKLLHPAKTTRS